MSRVLDDKGLLPLLPLLYVAWADGRLSGDEIAHIRSVARSIPGLGANPLGLVEAWLDPVSPPSSAELAVVLERIRELAQGASLSERLSLSELGILLAEADGVEAVEVEAMVQLEEALAAGPDAGRALLAKD